MIIGINGVAGAGKDSIGKILIERYGYRRIAFADRMREYMLAIDPWIPTEPIDPHTVALMAEGGAGWIRLSSLVRSVGWDEAKNNAEVRRLMIGFGHEGRQVLGERTWIMQAMGGGRLHKDKNYVVTDVRYFNEAQEIRDRGGIVWRVERPGYGPLKQYEGEVHSEGLWDDVVHNDGTLEDLALKVEKMVSEYASESA